MFTTVKGRQVWIPLAEQEWLDLGISREHFAELGSNVLQSVAPFRCPHLAAQDKAHAGDPSLITFRSGRFVSFGFLAFLFPVGWQDKAA